MITKLSMHVVRTHAQTMPPDREITIYDTVVARFFLRCRPPPRPGAAWASAFFVRYTDAAGRERKAKIGSPQVMDVDAARKAARALLAKIDQGVDPAAEKAEARRRKLTVREAVGLYTASPEFGKRTVRSQTQARASLRSHVVYHLGALPLADVGLQAARRLLRAVEADTRTNRIHRRLGGVQAAGRAAQLLSTMLGWCIAEDLLKGPHPLRGLLRLPSSQPREVVITEPTQ